MQKSVWSEIKMPEFPSLEEDKKCDVLIIGGGLTGVLCAYFLEKSGVSYILVEGKRLGDGTTKNTTGKITSQHGIIYSNLSKSEAELYFHANQRAVEKYGEMAEFIPCDFERKNSYIYSVSDRKRLEREVMRVNDLGFEAEFCEKTELPFSVKGAVRFPHQAQFNPMKFLSEISRGLNIFENTFVEKVEGNRAFTKNAVIEADKIIVATHFPFIDRCGLYFLKLYQHRSYVYALEGVKTDGMYMGDDEKSISLRGYNGMLLVGGGGHRTGKGGCGWEAVKSFCDTFYNGKEIKYRWAAQDTMSLDKIPYIGEYASGKSGLLVATGFNKWGMTGAMVSAELLRDKVLGRRNEFEDFFSPQRKILSPQLFVNGFETAVHMLMPTTKRCSHLGCGLVWNKHEKTWDCACHGSRFDEEGNVIDNPATKGIHNSQFTMHNE